MKNAIESASEVFKTRMNDPFIGTIIITSMIWNWKPIFILLFDNRSVLDRIDLIEKVYWAGLFNISYASLPPLVITLLWYFGYPHISRRLVKYHDEQKLKTEKIRVDLANKEKYKTQLENLQLIERKEDSIEREYKAIILKTLMNESDNKPNIQIIHCNFADLGDWVGIEGQRGILAVSSEREKVSASGVVVKNLINGFVIVQTSGLVHKEVFANYIKESDLSPRNYFITESRGKMLNAEETKYAQSVGAFVKFNNDLYFKISIS